jgi:ribosomal protein S18 acetylase RimI-like enzyme
MLKYIIKLGELLKKQSVSIVVFKENTAAYGCYHKAGFRIVQENEDTYLMGKQI